MKWTYACPHCRAVLNPHTKIILAARRGRRRGLILLSPQPGNYQSIVDESFALREGETVELCCPACGHDLASSAAHRLAEILLLRPGAAPRRVEFSRVYGEHATFILDGEKIVPYGDDAGAFDRVNFFGA
jgi:hypothetical protein